MDTTQSSSLLLSLKIIKHLMQREAQSLFPHKLPEQLSQSLIWQRMLPWADMGAARGGDAWSVCGWLLEPASGKMLPMSIRDDIYLSPHGSHHPLCTSIDAGRPHCRE